jgi:hypothetical protein
VAGLPGVKSEDRIEQVAEDKLTETEAEMIAVAPKRVRTMVVKPDGTLVPREVPAPAPTAASAQDTMTVSSAPAAAMPDIRGADPVTPSSAPVATSRPQPAARPAQQPQAAAPQQLAAADPAPAQPTAAAAAGGSSEWSMQIASQPTAEGAQSSYRDLLQRYGSVLNGRGVQIVKAEIEGKGTYYRVRIPAATKNDAIALCGKYKAAGGSCFVSK